MPAPTSYTEAALAQFLHRELGPSMAAVLGWNVGVSDAGSYQEIVNSTLLVCGLEDITQAVGVEVVAKLRTLGRAELWRAVVAATAGDYDANADGAQLSRSQIHAQALNNLKLAEGDAYAWTHQARLIPITRDDAYAPPEDSDGIG